MKRPALRTADERFCSLPDYPFAPHYLELDHPRYAPLRLHYVDEGAREGITVLLLHGCPAWSYLYRKVISTLQAKLPSLRLVAPDHLGCGKSDKLLERTDYSYSLYVDTIRTLITRLQLSRIVLVGQDWGGPIGLRVLAELPELFCGVVLTNTLLPNAEDPPRGVADWPGPIIQQWVNYTQRATHMPVGQIIQGVCASQLPEQVRAAYDAPFPDATYQQGVLNWPSLIPLAPDSPGIVDNRRAWEFLEHSSIPVITAFSDRDPSTAGWEKIFQQRAKGAQHQSHHKIAEAGHMVQEDAGEKLADVIAAVVCSLHKQGDLPSH